MWQLLQDGAGQDAGVPRGHRGWQGWGTCSCHPACPPPASRSCSDAAEASITSLTAGNGVPCQGQHPQELSRGQNAAVQETPSLHPSFKTSVSPLQSLNYLQGKQLPLLYEEIQISWRMS